MGVGGRGIGYLVGCPRPIDRSDPMPEQFDSHNARAAFDHDSTLVVALELSGKSWQVGAVVPGVARRPRRRLEPRDMAGLLKAIERWVAEAGAGGRAVGRGGGGVGGRRGGFRDGAL